MALHPILIYPDKALRVVAEPIEAVDEDIRKLIEDMAETMYDAPGVGLAAPQIGVSKRVFVIDTAMEDEPPNLLAFINPKIISREGEIVWEEGCLSFPGIHEDVQRSNKVVVQAINQKGEPFEVEAEGLPAVAIQHETDHLDGVLLIDHVSYFKRRQIERDLKKQSA